ncbi:hypothetical protein FLAV_02478 [Flavobacteriales bacterium]|nr:hypothetical protein FLAV_02478 [Flavobacteriales bacterium]
MVHRFHGDLIDSLFVDIYFTVVQERITDSIPIKPNSTTIVNPMVQMMIPRLIQKKRRFPGTPRAIPSAVPSGAPISRGANKPKPATP